MLIEWVYKNTYCSYCRKNGLTGLWGFSWSRVKSRARDPRVTEKQGHGVGQQAGKQSLLVPSGWGLCLCGGWFVHGHCCPLQSWWRWWWCCAEWLAAVSTLASGFQRDCSLDLKRQQWHQWDRDDNFINYVYMLGFFFTLYTENIIFPRVRKQEINKTPMSNVRSRIKKSGPTRQSWN